LSDLHSIELDSDIWAVKVDGIISVTPLSLDLTARVDLASTDRHLRGCVASGQQLLDSPDRLDLRTPIATPHSSPPLFAETLETMVAR
jgi:hypothetical protein